jgi:flavoprotein
MKKSLPVRPFPDRKNNFTKLVTEIRSSDELLKKLPKKREIKSVYIHKPGKNIIKNSKNWTNIQENSKDKYLEKTYLMEKIRQKKIENKLIDLFYSSRNALPAASEGK